MRCSKRRVILFFGPIVVPIANSTLSIGNSEVIRYLRRIDAISALVVCMANLWTQKKRHICDYVPYDYYLFLVYCTAVRCSSSVQRRMACNWRRAFHSNFQVKIDPGRTLPDWESTLDLDEAGRRAPDRWYLAEWCDPWFGMPWNCFAQ